MKNDPASTKLREDHQAFVRLAGEATDALDTIETVLPPTWFGRAVLKLFAGLRRAWAEHEEELRRAARETYDG